MEMRKIEKLTHLLGRPTACLPFCLAVVESSVPQLVTQVVGLGLLQIKDPKSTIVMA